MGWLDDLLDTVQNASRDFAEALPGSAPDQHWAEDRRRSRRSSRDHDRAVAGGVKVAEWVQQEGKGQRDLDQKTGGMLPAGLEGVVDPASWEAMPAAKKRQMLELLDEAGADPFGDQEYEETGAKAVDQYMLNIGLEQVSNQMWRKFEMRETPQSRSYTGSTGGSRAPQPKRGMITGEKYMARINTLTPGPGGELEALQRQLYRAGFYGGVEGQRDQEPIWGAPDEPTKRAASLLVYTTMTFGGKKSIKEVVDLFAQQNDPDGDGKPGTAKDRDIQLPTIHLTNPLDVQMTAQDMSVDLMGRRLDDATAQGITGGYTGLEMAAGRANQARAAAEGGGGSVTEAPSVTSYAEQQLRKTQAAEIDSYTYLKNFETFLNMVGLS